MVFHFYRKVISFAVLQFPVLHHYILAPPRRSSSASLCGCSPISRLFKHVCNAQERPTLCLWHVTPSEQDCHIASMVKNILDCPLENSFWISGKFDEYIWTGPELPFEFESVIDIAEPWVRCKLSEFYGA